MANHLPIEKKAQAVAALAEGTSIRSVERMMGVHRDTIMRLGVRFGEGCGEFLEGMMHDLPCEKIEVDELWGFIGKKKRNRKEGDPSELGDVWTYVAIDPDSKAVPCWHAGKRGFGDTHAFIRDLSGRLANRIQLSSDCLASYAAVIENTFGADIDYGQIVKTYSTSAEGYPAGKYSPGYVVSAERTPMIGNPKIEFIGTSHAERQNLTMRMHIRRLTRLTNAFSKKLANFKAAVALHFAYYNLVKRHATIKTTPALALGVTHKQWTIEELLELTGA
ncbi:MAG: IS1 family transposase [Planctomycetes bacterium]|nr:IS1 family transposase [Planctomycetota bacterium]